MQHNLVCKLIVSVCLLQSHTHIMTPAEAPRLPLSHLGLARLLQNTSSAPRHVQAPAAITRPKAKAKLPSCACKSQDKTLVQQDLALASLVAVTVACCGRKGPRQGAWSATGAFVRCHASSMCLTVLNASGLWPKMSVAAVSTALTMVSLPWRGNSTRRAQCCKKRQSRLLQS